MKSKMLYCLSFFIYLISFVFFYEHSPIFLLLFYVISYYLLEDEKINANYYYLSSFVIFTSLTLLIKFSLVIFLYLLIYIFYFVVSILYNKIVKKDTKYKQKLLRLCFLSILFIMNFVLLSEIEKYVIKKVEFYGKNNIDFKTKTVLRNYHINKTDDHIYVFLTYFYYYDYNIKTKVGEIIYID